MKPTHIAYADESNWKDGRFRSICLVSLPINCVVNLEKEIDEKLSESNVTELKWKDIDSAKYRMAAEKVFKLALNAVCRGRLRIDTIIWDISDSRHALKDRDDVANLGRMYFHLLNNVLRLRWPNNAVWQLCPDEHNCINWDTLHDVLDFRSVIPAEITLFSPGANVYHTVLERVYKIVSIESCKSHENRLIQLSDIFAGMACFSKDCFQTYSKWVKSKSSQFSLFSVPIDAKLSNAQRERFPLIQQFITDCKKQKLGISLASSGALKTFDPKNPINFWWYKPQSKMDKAPVKVKS